MTLCAKTGDMLVGRIHRAGTACLLSIPTLSLTGCVPDQSALHPASVEAQQVATLFWVMAIAGGVIWAAVMATAIYAVVGRWRPTSERFADRFILWAGVVFPTIVLATLLTYGLGLLPSWTGTQPALRVTVEARQFWWRITYERPDGTRVETANELHLPLDQVTEFALISPDVIHSFWIPVLGGKLDAIPGRTNHLRLTPNTTGRFRGVCAEFCGLSHALMAFDVVVQTQGDFDDWLSRQAAPARIPDAAPLRAAGCLACHSLRGVSDAGRIGPDLTHLASRKTIAAGMLPNTPEALGTWLTDPEAVKPGATMPGYAMLPAAELDRIITLLGELE